MSQLLVDKERPLHRAQLGDNLSTVARARTLTVLPRLDRARKARVVQFLYESNLIAVNRPIVALGKADLSGADLRRVPLYRAKLKEARLRKADLRGGSLVETDLSEANLEKADLSGANLYRARGWTAEQLRAARSLEGAIMPNGQKYEDWLAATKKSDETFEEDCTAWLSDENNIRFKEGYVELDPEDFLKWRMDRARLRESEEDNGPS
jgi:hypothetical protein